MPSRLTKETKTLIKTDNELVRMLSDEMGISSTSINNCLYRNTIGLISYPVLKIISDRSGIPISNLIEEYSDDVSDTNLNGGTNVKNQFEKV